MTKEIFNARCSFCPEDEVSIYTTPNCDGLYLGTELYLRTEGVIQLTKADALAMCEAIQMHYGADDVDVDVEPFTLEVGKRYNRRDDIVTGPLEYSDVPLLSDYPFWCPNSGNTYSKYGLYDIMGECHLDLVSEYIEEESKPLQDLDIAVGDTVECTFTHYENQHTKGKLYEVMEFNGLTYWITDDDGELNWGGSMSKFKKVVEDNTVVEVMAGQTVTIKVVVGCNQDD